MRCAASGGELFSQRYEGYSLHVTALFEHVVVSWTWPGLPAGGSTRLERATLDNRWHWVALRRRLVPPGLLLEVDRDTQGKNVDSSDKESRTAPRSGIWWSITLSIDIMDYTIRCVYTCKGGERIM
ncbi:hypothetical protein EVAR_24122_1 [Eumeta japonica]|uniref:Uncharacterized protein n=1 Tax=Eumeta variegata TaxID=151549 RepID=A0A4C1YSU6_EUMVA|nr:hypothetical protein EVAR_24122_1 [Eumeta japonica]